MSKRIYVGNLAYSVSDGQLQELFAQFGEVTSAQVIVDRSTGRSKGFGFVEMTSAEEAQAAIDGLSGQVFEGRPLTVNEARPQTQRSERGGRGGYGRRNRF